MEKLKMHTPNLTQENIARIRELFPGCVTEAHDENSQIRLAVDFDQLRQELSESIVEGPQERYHLNWPGKREALLTANAPIAKSFRPYRNESVDFDTTKNLFIEGDNLDALKLLQEYYLGKVKMIYIDPPYNTGNDFIYEDDFAVEKSEYDLMNGVRDHEGNKLFDEERWKQNSSANGRFHSDWLSMIYPRLKLARNLLKDDGVIFISVDDGEVANLRKICDEIFGNDNFIAQFVWKARQFTDTRAKTNVSTDHEYIIAYAKHIGTSLKGVKRDETKFSNPDNDPRGDWMSRSILGLANSEQRPNLHYDIFESGRIFSPNPSTGWRYSKDRMFQLIADGRILFPKNDTGRPREKKFRSEMQSDLIAYRSIIDDIHTANGTQEIRSLFKSDLFPFPKPVGLIASLVSQVTDIDEIVIDLFAGSATTAHAIVQLNSEDGGNRKFIMVQLPEPCDEKSEAFKAGYKTIADIGKERIRRAGKKIIAELTERHEKENTVSDEPISLSSVVEPLKIPDTGFRVLKIDSSNMADVYYTPDAIDQKQLEWFTDNIKPGRTAEDLLFQVLLDYGVDLTSPIRKEIILDKTVFFVDENALVACFDTGVNEELVKHLAQFRSYDMPIRKIVFRDNGFASDAVKINVEQIFKQMSPGTEVKSI